MPRRKVRRFRAHPGAERIARFIEEKYDGNVTAAAAAIGCDYTQLYAAARGLRARGPSLALLERLAEHTGIPIHVWIKAD